MSANKIVETVKDAVAEAKGKVELIGAHGKDVIHTGAQTLQAAKSVVVEGGHQTAQVLANTKDELQRTLKDGVAQIGHKLSNLTTPTHKEAAAARKAEVKEKKQRRRGNGAAAHAGA